MIELASRSDDELLALVTTGVANGWGASGSITVDGQRLFLKRLPLTDVEVANPRSSRNWFRLPPYYSYGVGSAGFGAWRELLGLEACADIEGVPAVLHSRVLPVTATQRELWVDPADYVAYWNGSRAVGEYMAARVAATAELWIVLEHVPDMGFAWVLSHQDDVEDFLRQAFAICGRLRAHGIAHFDAHLGNVVVRDDTVFLADFGLALLPTFDLSVPERRFLDRHRHYDVGTVLASLAQMLLGAIGSQSASDLGPAIDERAVPYSASLWSVFDRYRAPMQYMVDHFGRLQRPAKRSRYDDAELVALLKSSGVALD